MNERKSPPQQETGLGLAVGFVCCAICLLAFPKVIPLPDWLGYSFDGLGLIVLLIGILGTCTELLKRK